MEVSLLLMLTVLCFFEKVHTSSSNNEPANPTVQVTCSSTARDLTGSFAKVNCPQNCLAAEKRVWGSDVYTDDSSICRAAIHAGVLHNNGGLVSVKKIPGQASYRGSPRNGINTASYEAWPGSFIFSDSVQATCLTTATDFLGTFVEVTCPRNCLGAGKMVWGTQVYADDSSVCRAAIHAGLLDNNGGLVLVEKIPGQSSYRGSVRNGITTFNYRASPGSFIFSNAPLLTTSAPTKATTQKPEVRTTMNSNMSTATPMSAVQATCSTTARALKGSTEVMCPYGCLASGKGVWGTDVYTDDSSVCQAAIHAGLLDNNGGLVSIKKIRGQASYKGSLRNKIKSNNHGFWSGSFIVSKVLKPTTPAPSKSATPQTTVQTTMNNKMSTATPMSAVQATCSTTARDLPEPMSMINCPQDCFASGKYIWGTDVYTDDSSVCKAAIHMGLLDNNGGLVSVEKIPGQARYIGSTRNGITTSSYGPWSGSFTFPNAPMAVTTLPTQAATQRQAVQATCSTTARDFIGSFAEVMCPRDCLTSGKRVWGTGVYTDDSSVCQAAIHSGLLDNNGGLVSVEKMPGQAHYQGSTRNGITTSSYGAWPGSFRFSNASEPILSTTTNAATPKQAVTCSTTARDLTGFSAEVVCPHDCLATGKRVWGTYVYTDDSSVCQAAIHSGLLDNNGGLVSVEKMPGQAHYQGSTRNGITTSSYGAWPGSFRFSNASEPILSTTTNAATQKQAVPVTCSTTARDLTGFSAEVICPHDCLATGKRVWGTDVYTDDSSVCQAAIHSGLLDNNGGLVSVEKIPGQAHYQGSTRNGITTSSYGAWPGSFRFSNASEPILSTTTNAATPKQAVTCSTTARDLTGFSTEVICPHDCLATGKRVWGTDVYTDDSLICQAAIHAGLLDNNGGLVTVEKRPGQASYSGSTRNGITTFSYGAWSGSFIFSNDSIPITPLPTKEATQKTAVEATCSTTARDLTGSSAEVKCPHDCLASGKRVWGTDVYTDDSSVCQAAIHAGLLGNNGGLVTMEKIPGHTSYSGSTRNGITTSSYGAWSGSFIFPNAPMPVTTLPTGTAIQNQGVRVTCSTTARDLTGFSAEVVCPHDCLATGKRVWGTDVYTDDSSVCQAAIHSGLLDNNGGLVSVEKIPGQAHYQGSTRNGITTSSYGAWPGSFRFSNASEPILSTTTNAATPKQAVPVTCSTTARDLTGFSTEVVCPHDCLATGKRVWGTDVYTDDSLICQAAIHAGLLDNNGGLVTVEKRPGQASYSGSTRNGITTFSYGAWSGSFIFSNDSIPITPLPTKEATQKTAVEATCSTTARDLTGSSAEVKCPHDCLASGTRVWGTDVYTDDSSVCQAAIHAGLLGNNGGLVTVEKIPGHTSYSGSTRNGITTSSYGAWSGSFIFSNAPMPVTTLPTGTATQNQGVRVTCSTTARDLTGFSAEVVCPHDCLATGKRVWGTDVYTDDSSVCQAAIHSGLLDNNGGLVSVEKIPGQAHYQGSTRNGITTSSYGAWPGSFRFSNASEPILSTTTNAATPKQAVPVTCSTTARDLTGFSAEVVCPHDCLATGKRVWGTDVYTDDSLICQAAIHAGLLDNNGGLVTVEKRPGQASYSGSTRNGITTFSYGAWSGSFIFSNDSIPITPLPTKEATQKTAVQATCSTTARDLKWPLAKVHCPQNCLSSGKSVWGTDVYTDDSFVCQAAIHAGFLGSNGGLVSVEKIPGQASYQGSTRNGITTSSYGAWPGSFIFSNASISTIPPPTKGEAQAPAVQANCFTTAMDLRGSSLEVICPSDCLASETLVWGTGIYTDDSSICQAAIHAGLLDNNGGLVSVEKVPGQRTYSGSTRNGITSSSNGAWSGSVIFFKASTLTFTPIPTEGASQNPVVQVSCSTKATELPITSAVIICPPKCFDAKTSVWGTDVYTDDSAVCQAAIHAGIIKNNGGAVHIAKIAGQTSYCGSSKNGITSKDFSVSPGSFIFHIHSINTG